MSNSRSKIMRAPDKNRLAAIKNMPRTIKKRTRHQVFELLMWIKTSKSTPKSRTPIPENNNHVFICFPGDTKKERSAIALPQDGPMFDSDNILESVGISKHKNQRGCDLRCVRTTLDLLTML